MQWWVAGAPHSAHDQLISSSLPSPRCSSSFSASARHYACEAAKGLTNAEGAAYNDFDRDMINALGQLHSQEVKEGADPTSLNIAFAPCSASRTTT